MTADSSRAYGGTGVALWHHRAVVMAESTDSRDVEVTGGAHEACDYVSNRLRRAGLVGVNVTIKEMPPLHVGLGAKTATALACIEAAYLAGSRSVGAPLQLALLAGRGGASGVGVNTYQTGGLVGDLGHAATAVEALAPSSRRSPDSVPPVLYRINWPEAWPIMLLRPGGLAGLHADDEARFFSSVLPLKRHECAEIAMALHYELPAAVVSADFEGLGSALKRSRRAGLKAHEIALHPEVAGVLAALDAWPGVAATMSSFGPTVVLVGQDTNTLAAAVASCVPSHKWETTSGSPSNTGRVVTSFAENDD